MDDSWKPVSKGGLAIGLIASMAFCIHALMSEDGFLLLDHVNLPFHEFGHLFFGIFGETTGVWGGTLMQLLIPFGILISFLLRKETAGVAFSAFWFGENFLNISTYIADARTMALPLVGSGDHDWNIILGGLGLLNYDTTIAGIVRVAGRLIMVSAVIWFVITGLKNQED